MVKRFSLRFAVVSVSRSHHKEIASLSTMKRLQIALTLLLVNASLLWAKDCGTGNNNGEFRNLITKLADIVCIIGLRLAHETGFFRHM